MENGRLELAVPLFRDFDQNFQMVDHLNLAAALPPLAGSPNIAIVRAAAFGLARSHDNAGIAPIIASCARVAPEERPVVAKSLLYFDSPEALRAAESTIGDSALLERGAKKRSNAAGGEQCGTICVSEGPKPAAAELSFAAPR
jgi:hypothetical protein